MYLKIAIAIAMAAALGWVARVNHLNNEKNALLDEIVKVTREVANDKKVDRDGKNGIVVNVQKIGAERSRFETERDTARNVVKIQSDSITRLEKETAEATRKSEENLKLVQATIRERDRWIERARSASTRTQRKSDMEEVSECNQVLDDLYKEGF